MILEKLKAVPGKTFRLKDHDPGWIPPEFKKLPMDEVKSRAAQLVEEDRQEEDPQPTQEGQPRQASQHRPEVALPPELDGLTINASPARWRDAPKWRLAGPFCKPA